MANSTRQVPPRGRWDSLASLNMTDVAAVDSHQVLWKAVMQIGFNLTTSCTTRPPPPSIDRPRCLPNFYVLGVPKAGSTELNTIICKHPDIDCTRRGGEKEMRLWNDYLTSMPFGRANPHFPLQHYVNNRLLVIAPRNGSVFGDATPEYLTGYPLDGNLDRSTFARWRVPSAPTAPLPQLIHIFQPKVRLLAVLREPVERAFSQFKFFVGDVYSRAHRGGRSSLLTADFFDATVYRELTGYTNCTQLHGGRCAFGWQSGFDQHSTLAEGSGVIGLVNGFYALHLRVWRAYHGNAVSAICFEELVRDPKAIMQAAWAHIGVDPAHGEHALAAWLDTRRQWSNPTTVRGLTMWQSTQRKLAEFYRPFTKDLALDAAQHGDARTLPLCEWAANAS